MALYTVAGLDKQIELPVPLIVKLIPTSQTNQRPGYTRQTPGYWVQHETGNYNVGAGAEMHYRYLAGGAMTWINGKAVSQKLSYHFTVDDKAIYQMIPVNEVTWQAADGSGPGNMSGISCELCVNPDSDWTVARHNAEALAGGVMKALGMGVELVKRHYDFNQDDPDRHNCPKEMMTSGYWPTFVVNVGKVIGGAVVEKYTQALSVPFLLGEDTGWRKFTDTVDAYLFEAEVEALKPIVCRAFAENAAPKAAPNIPTRSKVTVYAWFKGDDGNVWYLLKDRSRVRASHFTPDIRIRKR